MKTQLCLVVAFAANFGSLLAGWENILLTSQVFKNCEVNYSYPNPFENIELSKDGQSETLHVSGQLKVTKKVGIGALVEMDTIKCLGQSDPNSCRLFHRFTVEFCKVLLQEDISWAKWVAAIKGFGPCPIDPGVYQIEDMALNFNDNGPWRFLLNPEQYIGHWILQVRFLVGKEVMTCFEMEGDAKKRPRRQSKKSFVPGASVLENL